MKQRSVRRLSNRAYWALFFVSVAIVLFMILLRFSLFQLTLSYDEWVWTSIGQSIAQGTVLYRDVFDHKAPFVYLPYYIANFVSDNPIVAVRTIGFLSFLLTLLGAGLFLQRIFGGTTALVGSVFLSIFLLEANLDARYTLLSENFLYLPIFYGAWLWVIGLQKNSYALSGISGALFASAALIRQPYVLLVIALIGLLFIDSSRPIRERIILGGAFLGGGALIILGILGSFWFYDAIPDMYYAVVTFNQKFAGSPTPTQVAQSMWHGFTHYFSLSHLLILGVGVVSLISLWKDPIRRILLAIVVVGGVNVALGYRHNFPHYYITLTIPLLLVAAHGLVTISQRIAKGASSSLLTVFVIAITLISASLWRDLWPVRYQSAPLPNYPTTVTDAVKKTSGSVVYVGELPAQFYATLNITSPNYFVFATALVYLPDSHIYSRMEQIFKAAPSLLIIDPTRPNAFVAAVQPYLDQYSLKNATEGWELWERKSND